MGINSFAVDQAYVASVRAIIEIFRDISSSSECWWIEREGEHSIDLAYNSLKDQDATIIFRFPKIKRVLLFPEGDWEIVCLYPICREVVQPGIYWDEDRILSDDFQDWEKFWRPIANALEIRYSSQAGQVLNSSSTTFNKM